MIEHHTITELAKRLVAALPPSLGAMKDDLSQNFQAILQSTLADMNLITREEFDAQVAVLHRTREQLKALEAELKTLQSAASSTHG